MKGQTELAVSAMISVIVAAILLLPSAGIVNVATTAQTYTNESETAATGTLKNITLSYPFISGTESVTNSTTAALTRYVFYWPFPSEGKIQFNQTNTANATWNVTYSYYMPNAYITDATSRMITTFVSVVLAVLIIAFLGYTAMKMGG
jgi:hypothetical protein